MTDLENLRERGWTVVRVSIVQAMVFVVTGVFLWVAIENRLSLLLCFVAVGPMVNGINCYRLVRRINTKIKAAEN